MHTHHAEHGAVATAAAHARSAGAEAGAAGLVSSETSVHAYPDNWIPLSTDPVKLRERRLAALRRNVWAAGKLHSQECPHGYRVWFVTLTYDTRGTLGNGAHDWNPRHISDAIKRFRHWAKKAGAHPRYVWVAELQQKGTVHYHVALWLPKHLSMPTWDQPTRTGAVFWPYGMAQREVARDAVGYLMKYMSKIGGRHDYPKGCRTYGVGGLEQPSRQIRSWLNFPMWLRQLHGVGEVVTRAGRRVVRETGELLDSPFRIVRHRGQMFLSAIREVPARWVSGPWSSLRPCHA